jgi:hypothetical protein
MNASSARTPAVLMATLLAGVLCAGCNPRPSEPPNAPVKAEQPAPPVKDPSLPNAATALGGAAASGAQDTAATQGAMTKQQESQGMPSAGQANNHSSPSLEPDAASASGAAKP